MCTILSMKKQAPHTALLSQGLGLSCLIYVSAIHVSPWTCNMKAANMQQKALIELLTDWRQHLCCCFGSALFLFLENLRGFVPQFEELRLIFSPLEASIPLELNAKKSVGEVMPVLVLNKFNQAVFEVIDILAMSFLKYFSTFWTLACWKSTQFPMWFNSLGWTKQEASPTSHQPTVQSIVQAHSSIGTSLKCKCRIDLLQWLTFWLGLSNEAKKSQAWRNK